MHRLSSMMTDQNQQQRAHTAVAEGLHAHMQEAGNLSVLFDIGGIAGGAIAGALSDAAGAPACVSAAFVFGSVPLMCAAAAPS